ncbi:hypothetical protein K402DRAFT_238976 [Aulographum hederae CBS 113979]|uniref:Uncharacterized protein n=1 Tax=Aulographum hederae CBS 113979 TaxID=1176131 RepID=A0A6G1GK27_9PEZI|nr:hypothetical protein K402DRAFT_238976 [Aulographum hederae CBS 113979]
MLHRYTTRMSNKMALKREDTDDSEYVPFMNKKQGSMECEPSETPPPARAVKHKNGEANGGSREAPKRKKHNIGPRPKNRKLVRWTSKLTCPA